MRFLYFSSDYGMVLLAGGAEQPSEPVDLHLPESGSPVLAFKDALVVLLLLLLLLLPRPRRRRRRNTEAERREN